MLLTLKQAAELLGYSTHGLRKLAKRGAIPYFQASKGAPLKFKPEWLNEFIGKGTKPGPAAKPEPRPKSVAAAPVMGI